MVIEETEMGLAVFQALSAKAKLSFAEQKTAVAGLIQLIGSDRGDLAAPFSLDQPLHRPSGHASGFLD